MFGAAFLPPNEAKTGDVVGLREIRLRNCVIASGDTNMGWQARKHSEAIRLLKAKIKGIARPDERLIPLGHTY